MPIESSASRLPVLLPLHPSVMGAYGFGPGPSAVGGRRKTLPPLLRCSFVFFRMFHHRSGSRIAAAAPGLESAALMSARRAPGKQKRASALTIAAQR